MLRAGRFTARRKILLSVVVAVAGFLIWSWWNGIAITQGLRSDQMDWNGDGVTSREEWWQAAYAVRVERGMDRDRECLRFIWRSTGELLRVECRTTLMPAAES